MRLSDAGGGTASNEGTLSQSSTPSLAHRRRDPRSLEPIVRGRPLGEQRMNHTLERRRTSQEWQTASMQHLELESRLDDPKAPIDPETSRGSTPTLRLARACS